jgi:TIR domain-containing protein
MEVVQILEDAMRHARQGHLQQARHLIQHVLAADPHNEDGWLLMAYVAQTIEERRAALWQLMAHNPRHERIRQLFLNLMDSPYIQQAAQKGVFLSYAQADQLYAVQLAEDLRFVGVPIWLDTLDMPDNSDWQDAVEAALERCGLMLVVAAPAALTAENVQHEIRHFTQAGKIVVPLQFQPINLSALNLWSAPVDFTADYDLGLQNLVHLLGIPDVARQL